MERIKSLPEPETVTVADVEIWRDGGTTTVLLADASGREFACCFDYRLGARTRGRLYIWAERPNEGDAKLVPLGSRIAHTILSILTRHLDRHYTQAEQQALSALDGTRGFIVGTISRKDYQGYLLLNRIHGLQALTDQQANVAWSA